jgi:hypothetical protein
VTPKVNFDIIGDLACRTWQITSLSITQPHTTRVYAPPYCQLTMILNTGNSSWHKMRHHLINDNGAKTNVQSRLWGEEHSKVMLRGLTRCSALMGCNAACVVCKIPCKSKVELAFYKLLWA